MGNGNKELVQPGRQLQIRKDVSSRDENNFEQLGSLGGNANEKGNREPKPKSTPRTRV